MRLWSLHPRYLDARALVACWREGLLAYHVLHGMTRGYTNHPQLIRFRSTPDPVSSMELYLHGVCDEADVRGYHFDRKKLGNTSLISISIPLTLGQLQYETEHLRKKVLLRAPGELYRIDSEIIPHPIFTLVEGDIEDWEKV